jgi:hypothetical protein
MSGLDYNSDASVSFRKSIVDLYFGLSIERIFYTGTVFDMVRRLWLYSCQQLPKFVETSPSELETPVYAAHHSASVA